MATLEKAIAIAASAHSGQLDKTGAPYILHPLRMMMRLESTEARIVAVLHDVVEDTPWTLDSLAAEGFSESILQALDCVTKREQEDYQSFVLRSASHPLARQVKLMDLEDNMNLLRLAQVSEKDLERLRKYHQAWITLRAAAAG
jgi:(p)ppGpp synthase/HD superfamily hydrolase